MGEDLADRLDDLICAWDKVVGTDLDTVVLLLLGNIILLHLSLHKILSNPLQFSTVLLPSLLTFPSGSQRLTDGR